MAYRKCGTTGKGRFDSRTEALIELSSIQMRNTKNRHRKYREEPIRVYPCSFCSGYHLTSQPKNETKGLLERR